MERPGEYLKRERELRGVAFDDVCAALKLSRKKIKALEEDDYANLPHSTYVKGFIKSYCRHLGLDEADAVLRYEVYLRDVREREDAKAVKETEVRQEKVIGALPQPEKQGRTGFAVDRTLVISISILAVFIGIAAYAMLSTGDKAIESKTALEPKKDDTVAALPIGEAADKAVKEAEPQTKVVAQKTVAGAHILELVAKADVWVKVEADGREPREMTLRSGERKTLDQAASYLLTVGNAGNLELMLDGKSIGLSGASGRVVKVKVSGGDVVRTELEVKKKTVAAPAAAQTPPAVAPAAPEASGATAAPKNSGSAEDTKSNAIKNE
ncbi:MAG: DUF4115 domain-containing protein [Deltaproteobacteria bacterium]|nr:DUF4115 domain-containing protein [Deltaproteobacteria bacterium]